MASSDRLWERSGSALARSGMVLLRGRDDAIAWLARERAKRQRLFTDAGHFLAFGALRGCPLAHPRAAFARRIAATVVVRAVSTPSPGPFDVRRAGARSRALPREK